MPGVRMTLTTQLKGIDWGLVEEVSEETRDSHDVFQRRTMNIEIEGKLWA